MVVYVSFLFHIYQPPGQVPSIVRKIANESYRPLIDTIRQSAAAKFTININGVLTEQLDDYGLNDVITGFAELSENDKIEFTNSAKYHAILPLIPEPEIIRQIKLNQKTNRHFFGNTYNPAGFFPPELAIGNPIYPSIASTGHEWVIGSGIANQESDFPADHFQTLQDGLVIVYRDDIISNEISFKRLPGEAFIDRIQYRGKNKDYYVVIAQDGETYGHHVKEAFTTFLRPLLRKLEKTRDVRLTTISELLDLFPERTNGSPRASSWSTTMEDIEHGVAYPLWYHPDNIIHVLQHRIMMRTLSMVINARNVNLTPEGKKFWEIARTMVDRGLHSCQQWWASKRPWFSPNMVLNGLDQLRKSAVNSSLAIKSSLSNEDLKESFEDSLEVILDLQRQIISLLME